MQPLDSEVCWKQNGKQSRFENCPFRYNVVVHSFVSYFNPVGLQVFPGRSGCYYSTPRTSRSFLESHSAITPPRGPPSISCKVKMMWPHPVDLHVFPGKSGGCYSTPMTSKYFLETQGAVFPPHGPLGPSWIPYTSRFFLESRGAMPFHGFVGNPPGRSSADNSLAASVAGKEGFFWVMKIR